MPDERYKKLGSEVEKALFENFDVIYEEYKEKALSMGFDGELKFIREHGKVLIYVVI